MLGYLLYFVLRSLLILAKNIHFIIIYDYFIVMLKLFQDLFAVAIDVSS